MKSNLLTTSQVGGMLHMTPRAVSKLHDKGELKGTRLPDGNELRIHADSVVEYCREGGHNIPPQLCCVPNQDMFEMIRDFIRELESDTSHDLTFVTNRSQNGRGFDWYIGQRVPPTLRAFCRCRLTLCVMGKIENG